MRLITGPPGAGKTSMVLAEVRAALRVGDAASVRLLVPTATLARHLQNELAREGFVFPHTVIQTLHGFLAEWCADAPPVSDAVFHWIVENAARRLARPEFANVLEFPGFIASLVRVMGEFSAAGCDSQRLAAHLPEAPLAEAFLAVYREVDLDLAARGVASRAQRLEIAAERIARDGAGPVRTVWLDGFHALPEPELRVISALAGEASVSIALSDFAAAGTRDTLQRMGFTAQALHPRRPRPATVLVKAPNIERETEEIARRILEQAAAGRAFREMAVIVRSPESYAPLLRSTFARFGIPARFYFNPILREHAAIRFLSGLMEALLANWDHAATLAALRLAPRFADSNDMDRFDFAVREQIPNAGLDELLRLAENAEPLRQMIQSLLPLDEWRGLALTPRLWAARLQTLPKLFRLSRPANLSGHEMALLYRSQAEALRAFDAAVEECAAALAPGGSDPGAPATLTLTEFWRMLASALRLTPLRLADGRRNTVQVLSAHEARQWSVPVVFICGLTERQFPQLPHQDPFFPESARLRLNAAGIRLRTAAGFETEEKALFDAAITRGTSLVTLSYPEFDARGESALPSSFLDGLYLAPEPSEAVRPRPKVEWSAPPAPAIAAPSLLQFLRERSATLTPSKLESYLQCPFQYFGSRLMRLEPAPKRPEDRLNKNYLLQGNIVHEVLAAAYTQPETIGEVFDQVFERTCREQLVPNGYHTERLRNAMRNDLLALAADTQWDRALFQSSSERPFDFALDPSLNIKGRIDRIDVDAEGRAYVIDYKYSGQANAKARLEDDNLLQAPLYYLAAKEAFGVEPEGMFYVGLKGGVKYAGWSHNGRLKSRRISDAWVRIARQRTLQAALEIRSGRVAVAPANPSKCRYCDCRDICRVTTGRGAALVAVEGA